MLGRLKSTGKKKKVKRCGWLGSRCFLYLPSELFYCRWKHTTNEQKQKQDGRWKAGRANREHWMKDEAWEMWTFLFLDKPILFLCEFFPACVCVYVCGERQGHHVWSFWHPVLRDKSKWGHINLITPCYNKSHPSCLSVSQLMSFFPTTHIPLVQGLVGPTELNPSVIFQHL